MKNIEFTIQTAYSEETYFLACNNSDSIENQIYTATVEACFCDDYEIINIAEVTEEYMRERENLIKQYEDKYGSVNENFFLAPTNEALFQEIYTLPID